MAVIYTVSTNKGGSGKTSLVTNLAGAITKKLNKKVLIIDTDGQGNSSIAFGMKQPNDLEYTIYDVIMGDKKAEEVLWEVTPQLHIIPANKDMNFLEFDILPHLSKYGNPFTLFKRAFEGLIDNYDYVFLDTPPSMGLVQGNALALADKVIIPFAPETFGVNGLINIVEGVTDFKNNHNPNLKIEGVVGMMVKTRTWLHSALLQEARKYCMENGINMYETIIPDSIRFANATAEEGIPATWTKVKKNDVVNAYYDLLKEMI
ncbi:ParA family protein [Neobacillus sedimentimangrovi]|uniref:ParA family protein n=1 Tax=Neobacillus sedimentimangrovi TaxID=2699460 RepID=A0ABS8QKJ5_9BACI|nr:ParA family protein [Neobacillus sedimentimangrovi]